jgi:hypothetical protein
MTQPKCPKCGDRVTLQQSKSDGRLVVVCDGCPLISAKTSVGRLEDFGKFFPADEKLLECARALRELMEQIRSFESRTGRISRSKYDKARAALDALEKAGVRL